MSADAAALPLTEEDAVASFAAAVGGDDTYTCPGWCARWEDRPHVEDADEERAGWQTLHHVSATHLVADEDQNVLRVYATLADAGAAGTETDSGSVAVTLADRRGRRQGSATLSPNQARVLRDSLDLALRDLDRTGSYLRLEADGLPPRPVGRSATGTRRAAHSPGALDLWRAQVEREEADRRGALGAAPPGPQRVAREEDTPSPTDRET